MAAFFYNSILFLFRGLARFSGLWDPKSREWIKGRKNWRERMKKDLPPGEKRIWFHAASLGEFEQGRPLIEAFRKEYPHYKIVLTFFSPSGYSAVKNNPLADHVFYLPMDGKKNARDFIELVDPALAIFIKYEFWYHYYTTLKEKGVPHLLVSAAFRKSQPFFQWWGGLFRKMLSGNIKLFVQDEKSRQLLAAINVVDNVYVTGDTRYDRVAGIAGTVRPMPIIEKFQKGNKLIIAGSTWPADEKILQECMEILPGNWKMVIAPHEIDPRHLEKLNSLFSKNLIFYSTASDSNLINNRVLVIDNFGLLSSLYAYGEIAFVGGGFRRAGIHNTLEPAVFGLPVIFGPRYQKFIEAQALVDKGFATPVRNSSVAKEKLNELVSSNEGRAQLKESIREFMQQHTGATSKVMAFIREKHLV